MISAYDMQCMKIWLYMYPISHMYMYLIELQQYTPNIPRLSVDAVMKIL